MVKVTLLVHSRHVNNLRVKFGWSVAHLAFLVVVFLSSQLLLLLCEGKLIVSLYEGIRVRLSTMFRISWSGDKMAGPPLGVSLDELLGYFQWMAGA